MSDISDNSDNSVDSLEKDHLLFGDDSDLDENYHPSKEDTSSSSEEMLDFKSKLPMTPRNKM